MRLCNRKTGDVLRYAALLAKPGHPPEPKTAAGLKRSVEAWLANQFGGDAAQAIEFDSHDALAKLVSAGLVKQVEYQHNGTAVDVHDIDGQSMYQAVDVSVALDSVKTQARAEVEAGGQMLPTELNERRPKSKA